MHHCYLIDQGFTNKKLIKQTILNLQPDYDDLEDDYRNSSRPPVISNGEKKSKKDDNKKYGS